MGCQGNGECVETGVVRVIPSVFTVQVQAEVAVAEPFRACEPLINAGELVNKIVIVERGDCMFVDKVACFYLVVHCQSCTLS